MTTKARSHSRRTRSSTHAPNTSRFSFTSLPSPVAENRCQICPYQHHASRRTHQIAPATSTDHTCGHDRSLRDGALANRIPTTRGSVKSIDRSCMSGQRPMWSTPSKPCGVYISGLIGPARSREPAIVVVGYNNGDHQRSECATRWRSTAGSRSGNTACSAFPPWTLFGIDRTSCTRLGMAVYIELYFDYCIGELYHSVV